MSVDIVIRLRDFKNKPQFPQSLILEAAVEIERLRQAIDDHKREVWGNDEPQHASDIALYRMLPGKVGGLK